MTAPDHALSPLRIFSCIERGVHTCRKASLVLWRPTAQTRHLGAGGRLIDEDQPRWSEIELSLEPCLAGGFPWILERGATGL